MIKLSTFMNDPLTAHELYMKEVERIRHQERNKRKEYVEALEKEIKMLRRNLQGRNNKMSRVKEQLRQSNCQLNAMRKKIER